MATSKIQVTEGSGKNLATNEITEDGVFKQMQRIVLNNSTGAEITQPLTDAQIRATSLPVSVSGVATAANQATSNTSLSNIDIKTPVLGQALAVASIPVVLTATQISTLTPPVAITGFGLETTQTAQSTLYGTVTETAPVNDTASSGINGRLQRIAQNITSFISKFPAALGITTKENSLSVAIASDQSVPLSDGIKTTYGAATIGITVAALATDVLTITGSATKTIRIQKIEISGIQTTAASINILLIKRSTANTGGITQNHSKVPNDSASVASSVTLQSYTANPIVGTVVGNVKAEKIFVPATSTVGYSAKTTWQFGDDFVQAIVLRGVAENININLNGITVLGLTLAISITWTEE